MPAAPPRKDVMPVRRSHVWLVIAVLLLATRMSAGGAPTMRAAAAIDCAAPTATATANAATPSATPLPLPPADAAFPAAGGELTIFAAASLTNTFSAIGDELMAAHPGLDITVNFAGSGRLGQPEFASRTLVTQLAEGAGADVLVTADAAQMDRAIAAGSIAGAPQVVALNRLVIVVPADNPAGIATLADLGGDGVSLVLAGAEVPAGRYARQLVCAAAADPAIAPADFPAQVAANVVSEEENVRAALAKVALGEADAGIVYATDAASLDPATVLVIEVPAAISPLAAYPAAPVAGGDPGLAAAFIAWLLGPAGLAALASGAFLPAR